MRKPPAPPCGVGNRQITDAYLVALASERGARLVTFDRRLAVLYPDGQTVTVLEATA